jgi:FeoB-associated Cys-rich membrane protein
METFIVFLIVAAAAIYLVLTFRKRAGTSGGCHCGCDCGGKDCPSDPVNTGERG